MTDTVVYTVTVPQTGDVTEIIVYEANDQSPGPSPSPPSPSNPTTIEVFQHACSNCNKTYKGLRCLSKHLLICGQKKTKKIPRKRKLPETIEEEEDEDDPVEAAADKDDLSGDDDEHESPTVEILQIKPEEESDQDADLCFCCDEPLKFSHMGHVKCKHCRKSFQTYMGRDKHIINMHSSVEDYTCFKCSCQCVNAEILEKHVASHAEFVCAKCGREFTRRYHLERHRLNSKCGGEDETKEKHKCDVCGKEFMRMDNLRVHLKSHLGSDAQKKKHECDVCKKSFVGHAMLLIHKRVHSGERPFPCDLCERGFPSNGALRKHRRVHTGEKPYECSECHLKFAAKETLNRHRKTHTGEKPYKCDQCGMSFIQRTQLKNHMFHHTGDNGFPCPHCDQMFDTKPTMARHVASEHNVRFNCKKCQAGFATNTDLKSHQETMHGSNRRFICENCFVEFPEKADMMAHILECAGASASPVLTCEDCGKVYKRHDLLVKHKQSAHWGEPLPKAPPKKRGRPRKAILEEEAVATPRNNDELFNQLRNNLDGTSFAENCPLQMSSVEYLTEKALKKVLADILTGLLDKKILTKIGWPAIGVEATLEQVLKMIGVNVDNDAEEEEDAMEKLRQQIMSLLEKFIGPDLESMMNNYTVDQILHYMAQSVATTK